MRAGLLTFAVLAATASAAPRDRRHYHLHAHDKRAPAAINVVTDVVYATAAAAQVIVYVDSNGKPVSTAYNNPPAAQPTQYGPSNGDAHSNDDGGPSSASAPAYEPAPAPSSTAGAPPAYSPSTESPAANTPAGYSTPSAIFTPDHQPASSTAAAPASSSASAPAGDSGSSDETPLSGQGVAYTPYNADGTVKTQDQVTSDLAALNGYSTVRIYDTNSNQISMLIQAAKPQGLKVFVGFTDVNNVDSEVQSIIDQAKDDWDSIHTVAVGNEPLANGFSTGAVVSAINTARSTLRAAGFTGPVVTIDTFVTVIAHPELCENSDYPAANIHAFFDGNTDAEGAAAFVQNQAEQVSNACGNRTVVVTESGWPWQGETNKAAVPGVQQQSTAVSGLKSLFANDIILFTAYDDTWKQPGYLGCEQYWGFLSHASS